MTARNKVMMPAVPTARLNRWRRGTWINAEKWKRPRRIASIWGTTVDWAEWANGRIRGNYSVDTFPVDVHRVEDPR